MDSPCIASCKLNADKYCLGCYRHIDEIVDWNKKSDEQQLQILQQLPLRQPALAGQSSANAITQAEWQQAKARLAQQKLQQLT